MRRLASSWLRPVGGRNVSVAAIETSDLVGTVAHVLAETELDARRLVLEISETALAVDTDAVTAVLEELRALGVRSVIDGFATGYSAMSFLKDLPVQELKMRPLARPGCRHRCP